MRDAPRRSKRVLHICRAPICAITMLRSASPLSARRPDSPGGERARPTYPVPLRRVSATARARSREPEIRDRLGHRSRARPASPALR